jgi:hypothetical protein
VTPAERIAALELELDRLKERQDWLDKTLQGDPAAWVHLIELLPPTVAEITLDKAVGEARQGALAMATIIKTLAQVSSGESEIPQADPLQRIKDEVAVKRATKTA